LNKLAAENIVVEKIDAETNNELVAEYNVRNLPTVVLVDDSGKELYRTVGSKMKAADLIEQYNSFTNV
jgi:thioredoxin-related protein